MHFLIYVKLNEKIICLRIIITYYILASDININIKIN